MLKDVTDIYDFYQQICEDRRFELLLLTRIKLKNRKITFDYDLINNRICYIDTSNINNEDGKGTIYWGPSYFQRDDMSLVVVSNQIETRFIEVLANNRNAVKRFVNELGEIKVKKMSNENNTAKLGEIISSDKLKELQNTLLSYNCQNINTSARKIDEVLEKKGYYKVLTGKSLCYY